MIGRQKGCSDSVRRLVHDRDNNARFSLLCATLCQSGKKEQEFVHIWAVCVYCISMTKLGSRTSDASRIGSSYPESRGGRLSNVPSDSLSALRRAIFRMVGPRTRDLRRSDVESLLDSLTKSRPENASSLAVLIREAAASKEVRARLQEVGESDSRLLDGIAKVQLETYFNGRPEEAPTISSAVKYILSLVDLVDRGVLCLDGES